MIKKSGWRLCMRDECGRHHYWAWLSCKSLNADGFFVVGLLATCDDFQQQINAHELSPPFPGAESKPECFIPIAARESKLGQRLTETHRPCVAPSHWSEGNTLGRLIFQVASFARWVSSASDPAVRQCTRVRI